MTDLPVCLVGQKFMGRAHSNAYLAAPRFFADLPVTPTLHTVVARDLASLQQFAARWGWRRATTDWRAAVTSPDVALVDVATLNNRHLDFVLAALEAGKHVACEKPLAATLDDARQMRDAARSAKGRTFVWYNYRRTPAVALAHQLVRQGALGRVYHVTAFYRQGWAADSSVPLVWRFDKEQAGSGAHGDLGAHVIDMARFVTGDEFAEVLGAAAETFVKERPLPEGDGVGIASGTRGAIARGKVTVDDCVLFLARMRSGALASVESTRFATGRENQNGVEVNGELGALRFDFEDLNHLHFFDATRPRQTQGWTRVIASVPGVHPYAAAYWPTAHPLGYEHAFVNQVADMCRALGGQQPEVPLPDFADAWETQRVLEASARSAGEGRAVSVDEIA